MLNINKKEIYFKYLYKLFIFKPLFRHIIKNYSFIINYHLVSDKYSKFEETNDLIHSKFVFLTQVKILKRFLKILDLKNKPLNASNNFDGYFLITMDDGYIVDETLLDRTNVRPIIFINYESIKRGYNYAQFIYYTYGKEFYKQPNINSRKINFRLNKGLFFDENRLSSENFFFADHGLFHFNYKFLNERYIKKFSDIFKKKFKKYKNYLPFFAIPFGNYKIHYNNKTLIELKKNYGLIFLNSNLFNNKKNYEKKILNRFSLPKQIDNDDKFISYINYLYIINFLKFKTHIVPKIF